MTVDDVNRVLRTYVDNDNAVGRRSRSRRIRPGAAAAAAAGRRQFDTAERASAAPHVGAERARQFERARATLHPIEPTLPNGIHLIVLPRRLHERVFCAAQSRTIRRFKSRPARTASPTSTALLPYGTTTYGRLAYQAELDKIAANVTPGTDFSAQVLAPDFDRGVQLLADDELHPRFAPADASDRQDAVVASPDRTRDSDPIT